MDSKIYIVIRQSKNLKIGNVFEQTSEGFFELELEPYRSQVTGTLSWKYKRKKSAIAWPYDTIAPYVIEVEKNSNTVRH